MDYRIAENFDECNEVVKTCGSYGDVNYDKFLKKIVGQMSDNR